MTRANPAAAPSALPAAAQPLGVRERAPSQPDEARSVASYTPGLIAASEALAKAWNADTAEAGALPPIELTRGERLYLARAAVEASGAPELYQALLSLTKFVDQHVSYVDADPLLLAADSALAKARGQ